LNNPFLGKCASEELLVEIESHLDLIAEKKKLAASQSLKVWDHILPHLNVLPSPRGVVPRLSNPLHICSPFNKSGQSTH